MADIARGIKTFGTRRFQDERAAAPGNKAPILSAEVDDDIDRIYNAWNTGIGTADLAPGFIIDHAHLGPDAVETGNIKDGTITHADLGPDCVWSNNILNGTIVGADLAADTITSREIGPDAVGNSELAPGAVDFAAMAPGGSYISAGSDLQPVSPTEFLNVNFTNITSGYILNVPSIAARGTAVYPFGVLCVWVEVHGIYTTDFNNNKWSLHLIRDSGEILKTTRNGGATNVGGVVNAPWTLSFNGIISIPDLASHPYHVAVSSTFGTGSIILQGGSIAMFAPA